MSTTGNKGTAAAKAAAIEARVQQLQAGLRVERDKARRAYELAAERLGLLRDEVANAEQLVQERQEMLVKLATETSALEEQTSLGDEVTRWKQQVSRVVVVAVGVSRGMVAWFASFLKLY